MRLPTLQVFASSALLLATTASAGFHIAMTTTHTAVVDPRDATLCVSTKSRGQWPTTKPTAAACVTSTDAFSATSSDAQWTGVVAATALASGPSTAAAIAAVAEDPAPTAGTASTAMVALLSVPAPTTSTPSPAPTVECVSNLAEADLKTGAVATAGAAALGPVPAGSTARDAPFAFTGPSGGVLLCSSVCGCTVDDAATLVAASTAVAAITFAPDGTLWVLTDNDVIAVNTASRTIIRTVALGAWLDENSVVPFDLAVSPSDNETVAVGFYAPVPATSAATSPAPAIVCGPAAVDAAACRPHFTDTAVAPFATHVAFARPAIGSPLLDAASPPLWAAIAERRRLLLRPSGGTSTWGRASGASYTAALRSVFDDPRLALIGTESSEHEVAVAALEEFVADAGLPVKRHGEPISGGWGDYSALDICSTDCGVDKRCPVTCGRGTRCRTRVCSRPFPEFDGAPCPGSPRDCVECVKWSPAWKTPAFQDGVQPCVNQSSGTTVLCGVGVQRREVKCDRCDGSILPDQNCTAAARPPEEQSCEVWTWSFRYKDCRQTGCRVGLRDRSDCERCDRTVAPASYCNATAQKAQIPCDGEAVTLFPYQWVGAPWSLSDSQCSDAKCATSRQREVLCRDCNGEPAKVAGNPCSSNERCVFDFDWSLQSATPEKMLSRVGPCNRDAEYSYEQSFYEQPQVYQPEPMRHQLCPCGVYTPSNGFTYDNAHNTLRSVNKNLGQARDASCFGNVAVCDYPNFCMTNSRCQFEISETSRVISGTCNSVPQKMVRDCKDVDLRDNMLHRDGSTAARVEARECYTCTYPVLKNYQILKQKYLYGVYRSLGEEKYTRALAWEVVPGGDYEKGGKDVNDASWYDSKKYTYLELRYTYKAEEACTKVQGLIGGHDSRAGSLLVTDDFAQGAGGDYRYIECVKEPGKAPVLFDKVRWYRDKYPEKKLATWWRPDGSGHLADVHYQGTIVQDINKGREEPIFVLAYYTDIHWNDLY